MSEFVCICGEKFSLDGKAAACPKCKMALPPSSKIAPTQLDQTTEFTPGPGESVSGGEDFKEAESGPKDYGAYRVLREHARGGMGKVSVAVDEGLKREVALKELFEKAAKSGTAVERFLDEAEITAKLEHPGIVPVHAFGLDGGGRPFYTMKFVHGKTLAEAIKSYHAMPDGAEKTAELRELLRRFASVCQTMQFAHTHGILHRDLKPANIMLGEHGETLIMDWGLAKRMSTPEIASDDTEIEPATAELSAQSQHTEAGNVIGTPAFMSPEQASGNSAALSPASDIYSLGAVLYQILTGQALYTGKSSYEILRKVLNDQPQWPAGGIPKALEAVARKALAREPAARYPDAAALYRDVMNWLDDEPIAAHPDSRGDRAKRWVRKNTALATTLVVSALLLLTIIGTACVLLERARTQTVAAQMTAAEMKQKADAAREKAKQLKSDLERKELELEQAKAALAAAGDDAEEKARLQKRVDELTVETSTLREKISHLETFAESVEQQTPEAQTEAFSRCVVLNINQMREAGQVTVDGFETSAGSLRSLMDIHYNSQRGPFAVSATNPAVITLDFAQPQTLTGLTFTYMHPEPGSYEVEIADTLSDLDNRANSYRLLVPDSPIVATGWDFGLNAIQFLRPTELKIIRLTVRSAVPHIHLRGLAYLGFPHPAEITDAAPFIESPASNFEVEEIGDGIRIKKYIGDELDVIIPRLIAGKPVVELGKDSFKESPVQSVVTPDTMTAIQGGAFSGCESLQKIRISKSIVRIEDYAGGRGELHTIEVDEENIHFCVVDGVLFTADGKTLLRYPPNKEGTEYIVPDGVERIADYGFSNQRHLVSVTVAEGVQSIGVNAMRGCGNLAKVSLPESIEYIGKDCFMDCLKLENVTILENARLKRIDEGAFFNCQSLRSITIPQDVEEIVGGAFIQCAKLENITIPENGKLKKIGDRVFESCHSLQTFTVPQNVEEIAGNAFTNCDSLETFYVATGNQHFSAPDGVLYRDNGKVLHRYPPSKPGNTYKIPPGVEEISHGAFDRSRFLVTIDIPESVKWIGGFAFADSNLRTLIFPKSLEFIDSAVCYRARNLHSVKILGPVKEFPHQMFAWTGFLTNIEIAEGLEEVSSYAFWGSGVAVITLPKSMKRINRHAFRRCGNLGEVSILSKDAEIVTDAFSECNLENMTIIAPRGSTAEAFAKENEIKFVPLVEAGAR